MAQNQGGLNPPETNPEIIKIKKLVRYDAHIRPFTNEEIQKFCDYIKENPITKDIDATDRVPMEKIRVAEYFYNHTEEETHKKKLLDLFMAMFKDIQVARDALGVDPFDRNEGYLYFDPEPAEPRKNYKDLKEEMVESQRKMNDRMTRKGRLHTEIDHLIFIHGYLHRRITDHFKIPLPHIPIDLERSPEEKARTKDMLEKKAAAQGRKKPEPKAPADDEK